MRVFSASIHVLVHQLIVAGSPDPPDSNVRLTNTQCSERSDPNDGVTSTHYGTVSPLRVAGMQPCVIRPLLLLPAPSVPPGCTARVSSPMFPPPARRGVSSARLSSKLSTALSSSPALQCGLLCASVVLLLFVASYLPALLLSLLGVSASSSHSDSPEAFSPLSAAVRRTAVPATLAAARPAASLPSILEWRPPSSPVGGPAVPPVPVAPFPSPPARPSSAAAGADGAVARSPSPASSSSAWRAKADAVKAGFVHAYSKYEAACFGQDEYRPVHTPTYSSAGERGGRGRGRDEWRR